MRSSKGMLASMAIVAALAAGLVPASAFAATQEGEGAELAAVNADALSVQMDGYADRWNTGVPDGNGGYTVKALSIEEQKAACTGQFTADEYTVFVGQTVLVGAKPNYEGAYVTDEDTAWYAAWQKTAESAGLDWQNATGWLVENDMSQPGAVLYNYKGSDGLTTSDDSVFRLHDGLYDKGEHGALGYWWWGLMGTGDKAGDATVSIVYQLSDGSEYVSDTATVHVVGPLEDAGPGAMYRLYNPWSGEHFYTADTSERNNLVPLGWRYEGVGWTAPESSNTPVFRMYNPYAGEHHYTMDATERDNLTAIGWEYEGIGWYSDDAKTTPLYRDYNPNEFANNHNYTIDAQEHATLMAAGWRAEGYAWYGV